MCVSLERFHSSQRHPPAVQPASPRANHGPLLAAPSLLHSPEPNVRARWKERKLSGAGRPNDQPAGRPARQHEPPLGSQEGEAPQPNHEKRGLPPHASQGADVATASTARHRHPLSIGRRQQQQQKVRQEPGIKAAKQAWWSIPRAPSSG